MAQNLLDDSNIDPSVFQVHRLMAQATLFYHEKLNQILIPFLSVTLPCFRHSGNILNIYLHKLVGYNILRCCLAVVSSWRVSTAIFIICPETFFCAPYIPTATETSSSDITSRTTAPPSGIPRPPASALGLHLRH